VVINIFEDGIFSSLHRELFDLLTWFPEEMDLMQMYFACYTSHSYYLLVLLIVSEVSCICVG